MSDSVVTGMVACLQENRLVEFCGTEVVKRDGSLPFIYFQFLLFLLSSSTFFLSVVIFNHSTK